jgi:hypothetical protein
VLSIGEEPHVPQLTTTHVKSMSFNYNGQCTVRSMSIYSRLTLARAITCVLHVWCRRLRLDEQSADALSEHSVRNYSLWRVPLS